MNSSPAKAVSPRLTVYFMYAVCALFWGTGWFAIRLCVSDGGYSVLGGAALRYTLAAAILLIVLPLIPRACSKLNRKQVGWLAFAGILNAAAIALLYWGEKSVSGGLASVLSATSPIMAAVLALCMKTERITSGTIMGFVLALGGVGIIFGERLSASPDHLLSMFAVLGAALLFSVVNMIMKVKTSDVKPLQSSAMFFLAMSVIFWITAPCESQAVVSSWPPPAAPTIALVYLSVACSVLAFPAFFYLLKHSSLMFASTLAFVHPVIALITDCVLETEFVLGMSAYAGISVVLAGVVLSMVANGRGTMQPQTSILSEARLELETQT